MSDHDIPSPGAEPPAVERAIRRLPFLEREALLMKVRDRMTYAEIGVALGISAGEAEAKVASALVRLHARLNPARSWRRLRFRFRLRRWRFPGPPRWRGRG